MSRLFKLAAIPVFALGIAFLTSGAQADAGGFSISIGNYGYRGYSTLRPSCVTNSYYNRSYRPSYNYYRGYGHASGYNYHHPRRPHYDYHAPSLVPHRNHLDYVPGHWDYHHPRRHRH